MMGLLLALIFPIPFKSPLRLWPLTSFTTAWRPAAVDGVTIVLTVTAEFCAASMCSVLQCREGSLLLLHLGLTPTGITATGIKYVSDDTGCRVVNFGCFDKLIPRFGIVGIRQKSGEEDSASDRTRDVESGLRQMLACGLELINV